MPEERSQFDLYYFYLGIPRAEQPPNYYRLLDLLPFESDPGAIKVGYNRRMAHLADIKHDEHLDAVEQLKNELAQARHCLLSSEEKSAYDTDLRARFDSASEAGAEITAASPHPVPAQPHSDAEQTRETALGLAGCCYLLAVPLSLVCAFYWGRIGLWACLGVGWLTCFVTTRFHKEWDTQTSFSFWTFVTLVAGAILEVGAAATRYLADVPTES